MLNIAVVTEHFPFSGLPTHGRAAYEILRILARKVNIKVFFPHAEYPAWLRPPSRIYDSIDPSYHVQDIDVNYFNYLAVPLLSRPFNGWTAARLLLPHVRRFEPDLIFSFFLYPDSFAGLKIGKRLSVPVLAVGVGSDIHSIGDLFSMMHTRTLLREVDFLVTVSEDLRRRAMTLGAKPEKSRAIILGCDLSVFHPRDRKETRYRLGIDPVAEAVVYVGRIDVRKGLRELVEAAALLRRERTNLQIYLVGDGTDKPSIESLIQAHGAGGYVHLVPGCSFDDVALWMAAADVATLPSYMEGCPNAVLEALACGCPVAATNVGGIPEILTDECGQLVPPRDSAALAQALGSILDKTWDSAAISSHWGRGWEACAEEFIDVFESLLSSPTAGTKPFRVPESPLEGPK